MNRRIRKLVLTLSVAAVASLGASSQANAANPMELAIQDDPVFVETAYLSPTKGFDLMQDLNAKWLKVNVTWSQVVRSSAKSKTKPSPVKYDWSSYDALINTARARGVNVQMSLTG